MIEIIPNWHPIFVHFTVALIASSALFFVAGSVLKVPGWTDALKITGHWTLRLGAVATIFTLAAGLQAYGSVDHDAPSHAAMTDHRNWAFVTVGFIWLSALWSIWKSNSSNEVGFLFVALLGIATVLVGLTAYKGGELVYRYGLGVQSLPQSEGDGHDHDHGDAPAAGDSHAQEEADEPDGHSHAEKPIEPEEAHEHSDDGDHTHSDEEPTTAKGDPAKAADAFHQALMNGDEKAVEALLAKDVVILESGHAQHSREEYMSGHMKSDMAFLPNISREVKERKTSVSGDLAWIITHSRMFGEYKGQSIDMPSREMLIMQHNGNKWEITHVHWGDK